ncbi:hypothetical protein PM082_022318, partial [Marasmius tenuissimus]
MPPKGSKRIKTDDFDRDVTITTRKRVCTTQMIDERGISVSTQPSPTKPKSFQFEVKGTGTRIEPTSESPNAKQTESKTMASQEQPTRDDLLEEELSRRMKLLGEYSHNMDQAARLLLDREIDPMIGTPCGCKSGAPREVRCMECDQRPLLCTACWIDAHKYNFTHWAHVWTKFGHFIKHDISALGYTIPLGHNGERCPSPKESKYLIIADVNGIHATRVSYCGCRLGENLDKWTRLFKSDLFPSTVTDPQSAFTFRLLRHYSLFTLQAKITPYDYIKAIRRLTDNVFTGNVPNLYKQFMIVIRIWDLLSAERRSGTHHNPDRKTANDLIVECPACPTSGVNMEPGWTKSPESLRHLHQTRLTLDGNYQANHFARKNIDKNDVSLWAGRGYLPVASVYNAHCGLEEASSTEKSVCGHLKTINKQDKVKFKNMDISGIVNCQCCHIFIRSTANLQCGERWVCVDECLSRGVAQRSVEEDGILAQYVVSFDAMCSYCKGIPKRWLQMHPELAYLVEQMRWVIPVCHCRNHISSCEPLYLYTYKEGVGEFQGETAELAWDNLNAIGPSIRQMTLGSREDTLNSHIGDWNWRKIVGLSMQLFNEIETLKERYTKKRKHFVGLWELYGQRAVDWNKEDRSPKLAPRRKLAVTSVYTHDTRAPTLKSLVEQMRRSDKDFRTPAGDRKLGSTIGFLEEALELMITQEHVRRLARKESKNGAEEESENESKELSSQRQELEARLRPFRKEQGKVMPADAAARYTLNLPCHPENQLLCVPSDFSQDELSQFNMNALAAKQADLVRGKMLDLVRVLRSDVRILTAAGARKVKHARKQDANTRAMTQIRELRDQRDQHLLDYNFLRSVLKKIDRIEEEEWPKLTVRDTYRKSTESGRLPGGSRTEEGVLWTGIGLRTPGGGDSVETHGESSVGDLITRAEKLDLEEEPALESEGFYF